MRIRWGRLLLSVFVAEAVPIAALVALVTVFSTGNLQDDQVLAGKLGRWVGPLGGAVTSFLVTIWMARPLATSHLQHGMILGLLLGTLDGALLFGSGAPFEWLFVASNLGKVAAACAGALLAARLGPLRPAA